MSHGQHDGAHHSSEHIADHHGHREPRPGPGPGPVAAAVITVSDRSARGERPDASGPRADAIMTDAGYRVSATIVPDGADSVHAAVQGAIAGGARLIVTSGGTGVGPRDQTPEGTHPLIVKELPGIAEALRREGAREHPTAVLSRGVAGIAGPDARTLVVNLPGSVGAVEEGLAVLLPLVPHILDQLDGGDH